MKSDYSFIEFCLNSQALFVIVMIGLKVNIDQTEARKTLSLSLS